MYSDFTWLCKGFGKDGVPTGPHPQVKLWGLGELCRPSGGGGEGEGEDEGEWEDREANGSG